MIIESDTLNLKICVAFLHLHLFGNNVCHFDHESGSKNGQNLLIECLECLGQTQSNDALTCLAVVFGLVLSHCLFQQSQQVTSLHIDLENKDGSLLKAFANAHFDTNLLRYQWDGFTDGPLGSTHHRFRCHKGLGPSRQGRTDLVDVLSNLTTNGVHDIGTVLHKLHRVRRLLGLLFGNEGRGTFGDGRTNRIHKGPPIQQQFMLIKLFLIHNLSLLGIQRRLTISLARRFLDSVFSFSFLWLLWHSITVGFVFALNGSILFDWVAADNNDVEIETVSAHRWRFRHGSSK
mmetsp:Transcript_15083/g.25563  ORF Transcript_15083/g.25563 Transcript_15083/m.25563 type:complete len:290 (-) Transcript_15083:81-950(-)